LAPTLALALAGWQAARHLPIAISGDAPCQQSWQPLHFHTAGTHIMKIAFTSCMDAERAPRQTVWPAAEREKARDD